MVKSNRPVTLHDINNKKQCSFVILFVIVLLAFGFPAVKIFARAPHNNVFRKTKGIEGTASESESPSIQEDADQQFAVYFIDVGQGDSALILCDGHVMLIDGGRSNQSDRLFTFLKDRGVTHLDYIVATHPDDDHIGGLAGALNYASADIALSPVVTHDSQAFQNFKKYLDKQGGKLLVPKAGEQYSLGSSVISVLGPLEIVESDSDNNNSLVLKIDHGNNSFLFTGDAENKEELDILHTSVNLKSTVLKVGHHGSASSTGEEFLAAVDPAVAVISCGEDNEYGHPTEEVLERLKSHEVQILRTDLQGDITFFEKSGVLICEVERNKDANVLEAGRLNTEDQPIPLQEQDTSNEDQIPDQTTVTRGVSTNNEPENNERDYIVNTKTGKFHYPDCQGVKQMKEANKEYVTCDRQDLISQGYESCGICHP